MSRLSSGTGTFLFTDVEGSTQLWERHSKAMQAALARHDAILRHAIGAHGGHLFKTVGDAFYAAFAQPTEALAAALEAQHRLQSEPWEEMGPLRVRMALHTGIAEARDDDYFGSPLNRVARLLAAGHGGQILLSQAAADLLRERLPEKASLRDLGVHRLKDLHQPEQILQLLHPDLPADFPPLRSLEAFSNNLPPQLTSFIGREREIGEVKRLLAAGAGGQRAIPLLTLTGAGGCGKTRLALQVAADLVDELADGVWLVELAALSDPALLPQTAAAVMGVREEPGRPLAATLIDHLRPKSLLLILDNCEHLLAACAQLADALLRGCPKLHLMATSREGLGVAGETTYPVPSLSLPEPDDHCSVEALSRFEATRLFVDRAVAAMPSFALTEQNAPAVAQVSYRLDGIPLAIELAAARVRALPVEKISERLDDRFRLLTGGVRTALPRQQTLRALIDWSYDLLSEPERVLLRRLSVFAGGWSLEAAEGVCSDAEGSRQKAVDSKDGSSFPLPTAFCLLPSDEVLDLLTSLVEKSLVMYDGEGGEGRYRLLETVRQYGRERLVQADEVEAVRRRHRDWFLALAECSAEQFRGSEEGAWLRRVDLEYDNLRVALEWSQAHCTEEGLRLGSSLWWYWWLRGYYQEGRSRLAELLRWCPEAAGSHSVPRARALCGAGIMAFLQGDYPAANALLEESLAIGREVNDPWTMAMSLLQLGAGTMMRGDLAAARQFQEQSLPLWRAMDDSWGLAWSLCNLGGIAALEGDADAARAYGNESLTMARRRGLRQVVAYALIAALGRSAARQGDYPAADAAYREALPILVELRDQWFIPIGLEAMAGLASLQGESERAARLAGGVAALRAACGIGSPRVLQPELERWLAPAREALGEAAWQAAFALGGAMTGEETISFALQATGRPAAEEGARRGD